MAEPHNLRFYIGLHVVAHAKRFARCMISVNRLRERRRDFVAREWMLDSGAFTEISTHGLYRTEPKEYVAQVRRWSRCGQLVAAVSQDYMCEQFILERTGRSVREHQLLTVDRYHALSRLAPDLPFSADSMAWSWSARKQGRNGNCPDEAARYSDAIHAQEWQRPLFLPGEVLNG